MWKIIFSKRVQNFPIEVFFYTHILIFVYRVYFNLSIIFCQALIKFQLESSTEVTKRQISKVVMAIGSGEEGW